MTKTVITFGTYDLMHKGHINILERASGLGNRLVVGISTDNLNYRKKRKNSIYNQHDRKRLISSLKFVDEVFFEESLEKKREYILKYKADILVMGDDWKGRFDEYKDICQVIYFPRTKDISTTNILEDVVQRNLINYICMSNDEANERYYFLDSVIKIFNKHNLEYFIMGGTLLGAVRSKTLIPWKLDLDMAIFKSDEHILDFFLTKHAIENIDGVIKKVETGYIITKINSNVKINLYVMDKFENDIVTFFSKTARKIYINELYPLKEYTLGPIKVMGPYNPHNYFISCGYGTNYLNEGKIMQNYASTKRSVIVDFLIEKGLDVVTAKELIYKLQ